MHCIYFKINSKNKNLLIIFIGIICCLLSLNLVAQERTITGLVTDGNTSETLAGVNISIQGTMMGTITDMNGNYSVTVQPENEELTFSYIGFAPQVVSIGNQTVINVQLMSLVVDLDEVVFIGYGTQRRGSITGAISSVSSEDIKEMPIMDVGLALQGRAAGVVALSDGNQPGQGAIIRIRGRRSLSASNKPLYVVDGIPFDGYTDDIIPGEIESVDILKDASATAIYGSRGSNGVILITTNRGGNIPTSISYSGYYGITSVLGLPEMMNGDEFYKMKEVSGLAFTQDELDAYASGVSTDWLNLVLNKGHRQNHQLGIKSGNDRSGFALNASYFNEAGVISIQDYSRYAFRLNLDHKVSGRIRIGTST